MLLGHLAGCLLALRFIGTGYIWNHTQKPCKGIDHSSKHNIRREEGYGNYEYLSVETIKETEESWEKWEILGDSGIYCQESFKEDFKRRESNGSENKVPFDFG